mmetsp:Transcript_3133/g.13581  ORF Transcript_3133/g.13581 Transcript_3133/m.13581 type:complete len:689 (-) Transcript_3133:1979-4045(-)
MRVAELGGDVKFKLLVVLDNGVAQLDAQRASLLERLLQKQRLEAGVQGVVDILEEHRLAELHRGLERSHVVRIGELHGHQTSLTLHAADPLIRLTLRIDEQRPPAAVVDHRAVLRRERILGQALDVPLANLHLVAHDLHQRVLVVARNGGCGGLAKLHPSRRGLLSVRQSERPEVGDAPGGQQHVARERQVVHRELFLVGGPSNLLAPEALHELVRAVELNLTHLGVILQLGAVVLLALQVVVERVDLVDDSLQLLLLDLELGHHPGEVLLSLCQRSLLGVDNLDHRVVVHQRLDPRAQATSRLGRLHDSLGFELGFGDVLGNLADHLLLDLILVVRLELVQEPGLGEEFDGGGPPVVVHLACLGVRLSHGLDLHEYAHSLHDQHHGRGRGLHQLHLEDVARGEGIERVHRRLQQRHGVLEIVLALLLGRLDPGGFSLGLLLLLRDGRLDLVSLHRLLRDDLHRSLGVLLGLHQLRLERDELLFHSLHALLCRRELLEAVDVPLLLGVNLLLFLLEQVLVGADQLEIRGGSDVEVSASLGEVPLGERDGSAVHLDTHLGERSLEVIRDVDILQKLLRHVQEGILRPGGEPVDRGARDQRGELAQALAEGVSDGREAEHDVEVLSNLRDEKVVHQVLVAVHSSLLRPAADVLEDGHHIAALHEVRNLRRVEQVGDVLHEVLVLDLRVGE